MKKYPNQIYHYKSGDKWIPFSLTEEEGRKWNVFCVKLMLFRPDYPNPQYEDYLEFVNILIQEKK